MAVARPRLQQRIPFVDGQGRLSNEGLRALNDSFQSIYDTIDQIVDLYNITEALNADLLTLSGSSVVLASPGGFGSGRVLSTTPTIAITDGGAGSAITADFSGDTSDVPEGGNLYFTNGRARSALSNGTGMAYDGSTGVIAVGAKLAAYAGGDTPSPFTLGIVDSADAAAWRTAIGAGTSSTTGTVTSVSGSGASTGLTLSGGPITASGTLTLGGTLVAANGGTGQSSYTAGDVLYASGATALSKLAIGANNYVLTSNGSAPGWTANTGTGNVVRATQPQFTNTIGVGTAASASGSGVSFPATQSASTDKNTLDDYEEDTWTPTVTSGSGSLTSYTASGYYTKIGRKVDCTIVISITNNGTGSASIAATLPFTAASGPLWVGCGRENASTGNMLQGILASGGSAVTILAYNNTYPGGTGAQIVLTISYFV